MDAGIYIPPEEEDEIGNRCNQRYFSRQAVPQEHDEHRRSIDHCQMLHFYRKDKAYNHLVVGIEHRKGKKQRHIQIIVRCVSRNAACDDCADHAAEIVNIKLE